MNIDELFITYPYLRAVLSIVIFVVSMFLGYFIIKKVPSLLHTPLMSGMNALSGITIMGAILCMQGSKIFAIIAIILATFNVVGGFAVTGRMLKMFKTKE